MARPSFTLDDEAAEWVEGRLVQGQSKATWYRYAVRMTRNIDTVLDGHVPKYDYDTREMFVEEAVREKINRESNEECESADA